MTSRARIQQPLSSKSLVFGDRRHYVRVNGRQNQKKRLHLQTNTDTCGRANTTKKRFTWPDKNTHTCDWGLHPPVTSAKRLLAAARINDVCEIISTFNVSLTVSGVRSLTLLLDSVTEMARGEISLSFLEEWGSIGPGLVLVSDA